MEKNFLELMKEKYGSEDKYIEALIEGEEDVNDLIEYVSTMTDDPVVNNLMLITLFLVLSDIKLGKCKNCTYHREIIII